MPKDKSTKKLSYAEAGVDIKAGDEAVERIKSLARKTFSKNVLSEIGSFGGFFKPDLEAYKEPVIISSADGVGTKLKLAFMTGRHNTVGEDLVNHCINDILVHGSRPLFFMDYIATGKLKPQIIADIVEGLSRGCEKAGIALLGGETAEMPDFYKPGEYDLAGFIIGLVDQKKVINGTAIKEGDICLGLTSNGLHTNGYSLARKAAFEVAGHKPNDFIKDLNQTVAEALMLVHRCYAPIVHPLLDKYEIHGMAHITGGGITGNLRRIIPDGLSAEIDKGSWPVPPVFTWLEKAGNLDPEDMFNTFNMGIGYIIVVDSQDADNMVESIKQAGETSFRIGVIKTGPEKVRLK
ncbi:MAG: phosphoribosylformylglycinamidine cyclo-ligase [candidate division Zixibacteria bacterium]|nr:phosphoribosylformylglycinamidine cyclo-ligase [candidate division Zixibacteria bacterium]